ncbi:MAG TPA: hypothetical protein VFI03_02015 [Solirubrobacterales bacterium]|nr:hypothetical protein [Solirubrobacterales bacterium]
MRRTRLPVLLVAAAAIALLLSGCVWLKGGSVALTQPGGIGGVNLRFSICTTVITEEGKSTGCGSESTTTEGQFFVGLVVPVGTQAPEALTVTPGPGAGPLTLTRSPAVAPALSSNPLLAEAGTVVPPPGSEILGYASSVITEPAGQALEWAVSANLGLPPVADGGTYGGPLRVAVLPASREVTPERPASRAFSCSAEGDLTFCSATETVVELGTSDLKIGAPASTAVAPGTQVKVPFTFDFASSAAALPVFTLKATSTLPQAELRLSSASFSRAPSNATTKRAPATTRKVIVNVPPSARPGNYELVLTATAAQGGAATGVATLAVQPALRARLVAPRRVKASAASRQGIPVRVVMPVAGSKLDLRLLAQSPGGSGQTQLKKIARPAKAAGPLPLRLKLPPAKALALLAAEAKLTLKATISTPGLKPRKLTRTLRLR